MPYPPLQPPPLPTSHPLALPPPTLHTGSKTPQLPPSESAFRLAMNDDPMATSKLAEGIRGFSADLVKLEATVRDRLGVAPVPSPIASAMAASAAATSNGDSGNGVTTNGSAGGGGDKTEFDQLAGVCSCRMCARVLSCESRSI